ARGVDPVTLSAFIRERGWSSGEEAVERGFLDRVAPFDQVLQELQDAAGKDKESGSFRQVDIADWVARQRPPHDGDRLVAVLYAEGEILDGESTSAIGGHTLSRALRALREDDEVDAVVLRVDSPGGSAAASDLILREMQLLRERKPVVVSMGGVAASGGYWISCHASRIIADPATITGSIGVFGMMPDLSPLLARAGVRVSTVRTSPFADATSMLRSRNAQELERVQQVVDGIYEGFLDRVSSGRNLPRERVHEIAQGRIWSGADAVELGLVDSLGGLMDAVSAAADLVGGVGYSVRWMDKEAGPLDRAVQEIFQGSAEPVARIPEALLAAARDAWALANIGADRPALLARLPFNLRAP
ncbi:MAG: signal peptide peptidase SppA, partial [Chloroflexota bacterium]